MSKRRIYFVGETDGVFLRPGKLPDDWFVVIDRDKRESHTVTVGSYESTRISTLAELKNCARCGESVVVQFGMFAQHTIRPAAFIINMSGQMILRMIERGMYRIW